MTKNSDQQKTPRYILFSPWPVKEGAGVNNVILGLRDAMLGRYDPVIAVTSWTPPCGGQVWLRLHRPGLPLKNLFGSAFRFAPDLLRLRNLTRGAVAVNPHYVGLQYLPLAVLRFLRLCPPLILSVHGSDIVEILRSSGLSRALYQWLFSTADLIVACSHALAARAAEISAKAKIVCVWNGVTPPTCVPANRPLQARYIICVAGFHFNKGHDILLAAFQQIATEYRDLELVLIGSDAPRRQSVMAAIAERRLESKVHVLLDLPHDRVWHWTCHAECLVLASRDEGLALCLLEAALVRTPVIATRVGGIPEIVPDGVHGLLCPPEDPCALAAAICATLSQPEAAQARAERFWQFARTLTWDAAFDAYRAHARLR